MISYLNKWPYSHCLHHNYRGFDSSINKRVILIIIAYCLLVHHNNCVSVADTILSGQQHDYRGVFLLGYCQLSDKITPLIEEVSLFELLIHLRKL